MQRVRHGEHLGLLWRRPPPHGFLWLFNFGDKISSVRMVGRAAILYSETNYRGSSYYVGANQNHELSVVLRRHRVVGAGVLVDPQR
jgi:hypothetical protein